MGRCWDYIRCQVLAMNSALMTAGIVSLGLGIMFKVRTIDSISDVTSQSFVYPWLLIGLGLLQIVLAFFGIISLFLTSILMLLIVCFFLFVIVFTQLAFAIKASITFDDLRHEVYMHLNQSFTAVAADKLPENLDLIQSRLQCCGLWSPKNYRFDPPSSCCGRIKCTQQNAYAEGCVMSLTRYFEEESRIYAGFLFAAMFVEVLITVFQIWMIHVLQRTEEGAFWSILYRRTDL